MQYSRFVVSCVQAVVSPGGVGFDINCGVRLLRTNLTEDQVQPVKEQLAQVRLHEHTWLSSDCKLGTATAVCTLPIDSLFDCVRLVGAAAVLRLQVMHLNAAIGCVCAAVPV